MTSRVEPRIDPRVERSRAAVLEATLDELIDVGYGHLSIEGVARRAGVGKATIYRHWDGKPDLVANALRGLRLADADLEHDSPLEGVRHRLEALAEHLRDSRLSSCLPAIIAAAEWDADVRDFHYAIIRERRSDLVTLLDEAVRRGELSADADTAWLAELLVSPLLTRRLLTADRFPPEAVARLMTAILGPYQRP